MDAALWLEGLDEEDTALVKAERERQAKAGIQTVEFDAATSQEFLKKANDVAWQSVIAKAPETGKKLRALAGN